MKRILSIVIFSVIMISCNRKQPDATFPSAPPVNIPQRTDNTTILADSHFYWTADLDQEDGLVMKKLFPISKDSMSVESMISRINEEYPEMELKYKKQSHDTLYLRVERSNYLTEKMGSTGAEAYLAAVTYNMTELDGIDVVDIAFKMGDHAEPGTYTRTDFIHETKK